MRVPEQLIQTIASERSMRERRAQTGLGDAVLRGEEQDALESVMFFTAPKDLLPILAALRSELRERFGVSDALGQESTLRFLSLLALSLRSFLPRWHLQNTVRYPQEALTAGDLEGEAVRLRDLADELALLAPSATKGILACWREETAARLRAEKANLPEDEARLLVGQSPSDYMDNLSALVAASHLRRIAEMRHQALTITELSNDYASFLRHTMYLGVSFVTCNPPLVDIAWAVDEPERWTSVVDNIISRFPKADADRLAQLVTLEVVLANMRLLRPIFLLSGGQMGCVCLQVNPNNHGSAPAMISEALFIYEEMRSRLDGGVPNVVFKLPGTQHGLEACRSLTGRGIGVTITVCFGMFQHVPFAEAIAAGDSIYSNLVEMNGRLAYPVRDELLANLGSLSELGIDETQVREAAAWAGVAVIRRIQGLLEERGYDLRRVKTLIASLRIYEGEQYAGLPSPFPDVTEVIGASILSVFPDVRRAFDAQELVTLVPNRIASPVPEHVLDVLSHSELFRQAYYVSNREWIETAAEWVPVHNTLSQFCDAYDRFVQRILARKEYVRSQSQRA